jgi:hypothetical protein
VVDHVKPLECGGADAPGNMQWQTVAAGKAKDETERNCRLVERGTAFRYPPLHLLAAVSADFIVCPHDLGF